MKAVLSREALVLDEEATEKVRRKEYSASTSKTLASECTASYAFGKIVGETKPNLFAATDLGSAAHSVLEELYKMPPGKRTERQAVNALLLLEKQWGKEMYPELRNPITSALWRSAVIERYQGIFDIEDPRRTEVVRTEWPIKGIELHGVPFTGFVDLTTRIEARGKKGLRIIDHKSSNKVPDKRSIESYGDDHGDQIRLYAAAMRQIQDEPVLEGRIYYTKHGVSKIVAVSDPRVKETLGAFSRSWDRHNELVEAKRFPTKTGPLCGWCPLIKVCPAGIAAGRFDKVGTALEPHEAKRLIEVDDSAPVAVAEPSRQDVPPPTEPSDGDVPPDDEYPFEEGTPMTTPRISEDKPWEEFGPDGLLNGTSYAAIGYFGLASWAAEIMHTHDIPMQKTSLHGIAFLLADITTEIQEALTDRRSWMDGTNTRVRGVLRTVIETTPPPFGESAEAWQTWRTGVTKRAKAICGTAMRIGAAKGDFQVDYAALSTIAPKNVNEKPALADS